MVGIICTSLLFLIYSFTKWFQNFKLFSIMPLEPERPKRMSTVQFAHRKKFFYGFKHTNNYRPPKHGEWFQSETHQLPLECKADWPFDEENYSKRCRWILSKDEANRVKPTLKLFHSLPHLRERRISRELEEKNTVRVGKRWLRAMLTQGQTNLKLEPIIEGAVINLSKNLLTSGFRVVIEDPIIGNKTREYWDDITKRLNTTSVDEYGYSDLKESLKIDEETPREFQYGGVTICNLALEGHHMNWHEYQKTCAIVVLENTLLSTEGWAGCNSLYDLARKIEMTKVDEFVKKWVNELSAGHYVCIISSLPEFVANEVYRKLKRNDVKFSAMFSRRPRQIQSTNHEIIAKIVDDLPGYKINLIIDALQNNFDWTGTNKYMNKFRIFRI